VTGFTGAQPLSIIEDYGALGKGASQAHYVRAENGSEYIAKGRQFSPDHPYVGLTELVTSSLADRVGLPTLDFRVLDMGGELFFGSAWMTTGSFAPAITEALLDQCLNRDRIYDIAAFDVWICNIDRHQENLVVRENRQAATGVMQRTLLLNDHSHCFVRPHETPSILPNRISEPLRPDFVRLDFLRDRIRDPRLLGRAIGIMEALPDGTIEAMLGSVPDAFATTVERGLVRDFLIDRKNRLRSIFVSGRNLFPNLGAGAI
jgi:hypothetical protein